MLADVVFEIQGVAQLIQSAFYGFGFYFPRILVQL